METCVIRVRDREHEGGLQGPQGAAVVRMSAAHKDRQPPSPRERFASVCTVRSDARELEAALRRWAQLPQPDAPAPQLPPGAQLLAARPGSASAASGAAGAAGVAAAPAAGRMLEGGGGRGFLDALVQMASAPERFSQPGGSVLSYDELVVVATDKFPKAAHHFLIIAREDGLHRLQQLRRSHLPLLRRMRAAAELLVAPGGAGGAGSGGGGGAGSTGRFIIGFHAEPSMRQLHCHVVSWDLDSYCVKNKKHYNSFTTAFFVPLAAVEAAVVQEGQAASAVPAAAEALLKQSMRCHHCGADMTTIPSLKAHLKTHAAGSS